MGSSARGWGNSTSLNISNITKSIMGKTEEIKQKDLSNLYDEQLKNYNNRNYETVNKTLDDIKNILKDEIEGSIDLIYGGSVAKHTYVDGISDIDCLLKVNDINLSPQEVLSIIHKKIIEKGYDAEIGSMAITINKNSEKIQIVPALQKNDDLYVKSWKENTWSKINPKKFSDKLTECNQNCGYKLIPLIKLTKAINATLPEDLKLSGYHIESLAIDSFKNYNDSYTLPKMLPYFIDKISNNVNKPIVDKTGQSRHVDEYLGEENSSIRQQISHIYKNLYEKMTDAYKENSIETISQIINGEL